MKVGFIGLGNLGSKLAASLVRNGVDVTVHDINQKAVTDLKALGAGSESSPKDVAAHCDVIITCLPSPQISAAVLEADDGILAGIRTGATWVEMSTTDESEVKRLAVKINEAGGNTAECPVSGGCHRAATANISIFAGCEREVFEDVFPILKLMGRRILHTGPLGSASVLKVVTNFLATANLVAISEALVTCQATGMDMNVAYEAIKISSGNSFVHETESQLILNGSREIDFTMDLVIKDVGLFQRIAEQAGVPVEMSPMLLGIFNDGVSRYGEREWSTNIIKRLEDKTDQQVHADGFPSTLTDDEPEIQGFEVKP